MEIGFVDDYKDCFLDDSRLGGESDLVLRCCDKEMMLAAYIFAPRNGQRFIHLFFCSCSKFLAIRTLKENKKIKFVEDALASFSFDFESTLLTKKGYRIYFLTEPKKQNEQKEIMEQDEEYEKMTIKNISKEFLHFAKKIEMNPLQVIRYHFNGTPLLYETGVLVPDCLCGSKRVFEFQLMPAAANYIKLPEFATVLVYTCKRNCKNTQEYCILQKDETKIDFY